MDTSCALWRIDPFITGRRVIQDGRAGWCISAEIGNGGIQLQGVKQLFTVSKQRSERYQDVFSYKPVEVCDERLVDMLAGTKMGVQFDDSLSAGRRSVKNRKGVSA
jgi:hypothetical protein